VTGQLSKKMLKHYSHQRLKAKVRCSRGWSAAKGCTLNEAQARVFLAQKALEEGRGAVSRLARLTGM
jgi:hypothetical protein